MSKHTTNFLMHMHEVLLKCACASLVSMSRSRQRANHVTAEELLRSGGQHNCQSLTQRCPPESASAATFRPVTLTARGVRGGGVAPYKGRPVGGVK